MCAIDRRFFADAAAFLMLRLAAARCLVVAIGAPSKPRASGPEPLAYDVPARPPTQTPGRCDHGRTNARPGSTRLVSRTHSAASLDHMRRERRRRAAA